MAAACQLQFLELLASLPTSPELRMLTIVTMADLGSQLSELSIFSQFVSLSLFYFLFVSWWYLSVGYSKGLLVNFSCHCRCIFLFVGQVMFSHDLHQFCEVGVCPGRLEGFESNTISE